MCIRDSYESMYQQPEEPTNPDIIDVDYKVVDEEEQDNTH